MSQLLVVFGATGQQGGSVIDFVINESKLSKQYKIRAITRSTTSSSAQALRAQGIEVVHGDAEKPETLKNALQGAHTVFSNTATVYDERLYEREVSTGKAIADASVAAGAQFIIYSTSTPAEKLTGRAVPAFDSKVVVEDYIKTLPIQSAFYAAGAFMQNWQGPEKPRPTENPGEYVLLSTIDPERKLPAIDIVADTGKFVGAMLANPDKYQGAKFFAASHMITLPEVAQAISEATGKTVKYERYTEDALKGILPKGKADPYCAMLAYFNDPGYFGPDTEEHVALTQAHACGALTSFDEFLRNNPMHLD